MKIIKELLGGAKLIQSPHFEDERGAFVKLFNHDTPLVEYRIAQVNYVQNHEIGILRGLHMQATPEQESKFFRTLNGAINLVFLDLRPSSSTYKQAQSIELKKADQGVLIPEGFATGYEVLEANSNVLYFSNNDYHPSKEKGVSWQDPLVSHLWKSKQPIVSIKDQKWSLWKD